MSTTRRMPLYFLVFCCTVSPGSILAQTKMTVNTAADLPRSGPLTHRPISTEVYFVISRT